jgi:hypothetical protein
MRVYEVRPRKDHRGADLISYVLPFGRLWYGDTNAVANAVGYAQHYSRSHDAVIRVYDAAGNVIETHELVHAALFAFSHKTVHVPSCLRQVCLIRI